MRATISGTVLEVIPEYDEKKNLLKTVTARLFQKGVKINTDVKSIPEDLVMEGEVFEGLVRITAYHLNNMTGISCRFCEI